MEKKRQKKESIEIDIFPLLKLLLLRLWLIVLVGLVVAGAVFGVTKLLIKPTYRCGFTAYVNNQHAQTSDKNNLANQDLLAAQQLTKTYSYIILSNSVLSAALETIDTDLSYKEFREMVSTEIKDETELISVYVVNRDPELAYVLANAIAKTAPKYMSEIIEGSSMKIVDYPERADRRYGPSYLRFALLGFLAGALFIIIKTVIDFFRDDKIKNEQEMEERFDIPILGVIPDISNTSSGKGYYESSYGYQKTTVRSEDQNEEQKK